MEQLRLIENLFSKVFGAAILDENFNTFLAETNNEMDNPLFHGEVNLINQWAKTVAPSERGKHGNYYIYVFSQPNAFIALKNICLFHLFLFQLSSRSSFQPTSLVVCASRQSSGQDFRRCIIYSHILSHLLKGMFELFQ